MLTDNDTDSILLRTGTSTTPGSSLKSSTSVQLTPLLATYVPARHSESMKAAIRGGASGTTTRSQLLQSFLSPDNKSKDCAKPSVPSKIPILSKASNSKYNSPPSSSQSTLRSCPLFSSHAVVICDSAAHTHIHQAPASSLTLDSCDSSSDASTLVEMSSSLRFLPRSAQSFASLPVRRAAIHRRGPIPIFRTFSGASTLRESSPAPPAPPAVEAEKLNKGELTAFLGTTKRLPEFSLVGKVVCVSGAGRGLGLVQAEALLEAGAVVYALDRLENPSPDFALIQERAEKELGTSLHYRRIDVRDVPGLNKVVEEIGEKHGRLDGLIAAAGIQQETPALEYSAEDANTMFEVNITGVFMTAQAVAKQMIKFGQGGSIVMIASMSGTIANRGLICPAYNASKAGVLQLARNLASEWGEFGIRVNTISPGYIVTAMVEALFDKYPERRENWPTQNMLGRLSAPGEYRGAGVFLISDASSFMTGSDLRMDGGHSAW